MTSIAGSQAAQGVEAAIGSALSSPALASYAEELLAQGGSNLTAFQTDLLKVVIDSQPYASLFPTLATGGSLTSSQQQQLAGLRQTLHSNPAIQLLISQGAQLKGTPALNSDIAATAASDTGPYPSPTPTGDTALDAAMADLSNVYQGSPAFGQLAASVNGVLTDAGAGQFISTLQPITVASFIPPSQLIQLMLPGDQDPSITDVVKAGLEIVGSIAGIIAVIALAPEEVAGLALVGVIAGLVAAFSGLIIGIIDLGTALDCDHDGDPFDPSDVVGVEC
jgi:hypothetical protein